MSGVAHRNPHVFHIFPLAQVDNGDNNSSFHVATISQGISFNEFGFVTFAVMSNRGVIEGDVAEVIKALYPCPRS